MNSTPQPNNDNHGKPTKRKDIHKHLERLRTRWAKLNQDLAKAEEAAASEEAARIDALGAADFVACVRAISPEVLDTIAIHIVGAAMDKRQQDSVQTWLDKVTAEARIAAKSPRRSESKEAPDDATEENDEANQQSVRVQAKDGKVEPPRPADGATEKANQEAAESQPAPLPQATSQGVESVVQAERGVEGGASMSLSSD